MAALPYMPLYVADYLSDAAHLSTLEHGAYLLLIMTYWQRGEALPDDDKKLARITRLEPRTWARLRPSISEFFEVSDGKWLHSRVESELSSVRAKSLKKRNGGLARAKQMHGSCSAPAQLTDTDTDTDKEKDTPLPPLPDGLNSVAWTSWVAYRKKIRKPLKPASIPAAQEALAAFGVDQSAVVQQSIANGWTGLFELKTGGQHGKANQRVDNSAVARVERAYAHLLKPDDDEEPRIISGKRVG